MCRVVLYIIDNILYLCFMYKLCDVLCLRSCFLNRFVRGEFSRLNCWSLIRPGSCESTHCECSVGQTTGDLKTPPLNYCKTVADAATLWSDRRCEIIAVANAPKYSVDRAGKFRHSRRPGDDRSKYIGFSVLSITGISQCNRSLNRYIINFNEAFNSAIGARVMYWV